MLKTQYRGYDITFSENQEHWWCSAIEFSHEKLSRVKERIDKLHLQLRKASSVDCLLLEDGTGYERHPAKLIEGKIVDYLGPVRAVRPGTFERVGTGEVIDHKVAVVAASRGNDRAARRAFELKNVFTLEAADMLPELHRQQQIIEAARKEVDRIKKAMPRVQFESLSDLVKASEHVFQEGGAP